MKEPRVTFEENDFYNRNTFRFYDNYIERLWSSGFRSGREIYPTATIAEDHDQQTTFAYGFSRPLRMLAAYLVIGAVLQFGFEHPILEVVGFVMYGLAGLTAIVAAMKIRKDVWIYVNQTDGSTLFAVREKGLKGISPEEFMREITRYAKKG